VLLCDFYSIQLYVRHTDGAGRARARDSECFLIVERGSTNEKRELENLRREELMMAALSTFDQMPPDRLQRQIEQQRVGLAALLRKHVQCPS